MTEAELCQIYGSRAREVMNYKISMGEFQEGGSKFARKPGVSHRTGLGGDRHGSQEKLLDSCMALLHGMSVDV